MAMKTSELEFENQPIKTSDLDFAPLKTSELEFADQPSKRSIPSFGKPILEGQFLNKLVKTNKEFWEMNEKEWGKMDADNVLGLPVAIMKTVSKIGNALSPKDEPELAEWAATWKMMPGSVVKAGEQGMGFVFDKAKLALPSIYKRIKSVGKTSDEIIEKIVTEEIDKKIPKKYPFQGKLSEYLLKESTQPSSGWYPFKDKLANYVVKTPAKKISAIEKIAEIEKTIPKLMPASEQELKKIPIQFKDHYGDILKRMGEVPEISKYNLAHKGVAKELTISGRKIGLSQEQIDQKIKTVWAKLDYAGKIINNPQKSIGRTDELITSVNKNVSNIVSQFQKDEEYIRQIKKFSFKDFKEKAAIRIWDDTANIRGSLEKVSNDIRKKIKVGQVPENEINGLLEIQKFANNAVQKRVLERGASSEATRIFQSVDKAVFKDMTQAEITDLSRIRESLRTLEIAPRGVKTSGGLNHQDFLNEFKSKDPVYFEKLMNKSRQIQTIFQDQLKQLLDNGLIDQQQFKNISAKGIFYNPRKVVEYIDPGLETIRNGRKITIGDSGLPYLKTGTEKVLEKDIRYLVQDSVARIQSRIFRNKANQALYDFAVKAPDNGFVKLYDGTKLSPLEDTVNVMINGEKKQMIMPAKLAEEWKGLDPILSRNQANMLGWLSGTKILKAFATGVNPIFSIRNMARDIGYVYLNTKEYSAFIPKFTGQLIKDYGITFKDALLKKGAAMDYIKQGGGMETLTRQGRLFDKHLQKAQDFLGAINEFSERWTRLALRNRAIKNGKLPEEATFIARDELDFAQGGTWTTAANSFIPYLKPGIQGTRKTIQTAIKDPKLFAWKIANIGSISGGLYFYNRINFKNAYDKIPSRDKANNWILITPLTYLDKNGEEQNYYLSVPKDQSQRIFTSIFDNICQESIDDKVDTDQTILAFKDFANLFPAGEGGMPPIAKALIGYKNNLNLYRSEPIWKGDAVPAQKEYTEYTPEAYKLIGKTGLSPERSRYALEQFFTSNNTFTNYFGIGLNQILKMQSKEDRALTSEEIMKNIPGARAFLRGTSSDYKLLQENKEIKKQIAGEKLDFVRDQNRIFRIIERGNTIENRKLMSDWIQIQPILKREWLVDRYENMIKLQTMGKKNNRWWMDIISEENPEAKAMMVYNKWKDSDPVVKKEIIRRIGALKGFGDKFWAEFKTLEGKK